MVRRTMNQSRNRRLMAPYASSPRRWLIAALFVAAILALGAFGVLP